MTAHAWRLKVLQLLGFWKPSLHCMANFLPHALKCCTIYKHRVYVGFIGALSAGCAARLRRIMLTHFLNMFCNILWSFDHKPQHHGPLVPAN